MPERWRGENVGVVLADLRRQVAAQMIEPEWVDSDNRAWNEALDEVLKLIDTGGKDG